MPTGVEKDDSLIGPTDRGNAPRDLGSTLIIVGGYCEMVGDTKSVLQG
jgi:hypothetical protein